MLKVAKRSIVNLKRRVYVRDIRPERVVLTKARWYENSISPVIFMVDDFTNAWFDRNANGVMDTGEDWGAGLDRDGSAFKFIETHISKPFPEVKIAFLTTVGPFGSFDPDVPFTRAGAIDATPVAAGFFRRIHFSERYEIGYHGLHHGSSDGEGGYVQEWDSFESPEQAVLTIRRADRIFADATGTSFSGGKYCGYKCNSFGDASIEQAGFIWWCRDWRPADIHHVIEDQYYDMSFFGSEGAVVDIPADVHGRNWSRDQIRRLLKGGLPISIQEHIAPYRTDGRIQRPNVIDDIKELRNLFAYLRGKKVWYALPSEAAGYFIARERSCIYDLKSNAFRVSYSGRVPNPLLTLNLDARCICSPERPNVHIRLPDGSRLAMQQYVRGSFGGLCTVNIPIQNGTYRLEALEFEPGELKAATGEGQEIFYSSKGLTGTVRVKVDPSCDYLYCSNTGEVKPARRKEDTVTFLCVNSGPGDRLVPVRGGK